MRSLEHPGSAYTERIQYVPAGVRTVDIELARGVALLPGLTAAISDHGATSAVLSLRSGSLAPMAFVLPALSRSPEHAVYYSDRFEAIGAARIDSGCITYGQREGRPWLHCHAVWIESDGRRHCGHVLPAESKVDEPIHLNAWLLEGADFVARADHETNFTLFQPVARLGRNGGGDAALVVRVRPNEDICTALESVCAAHGIRRARIRGGVGSLIGAVFDDGRAVEPFITEVFIRRGLIAPGPDGSLRADVDVGMVDHTGRMSEGRLSRGQNPVLVTFEFVIEALDGASFERARWDCE